MRGCHVVLRWTAPAVVVGESQGRHGTQAREQRHHASQADPDGGHPKLHPVGANMNHTSASTSVKLMRKGLYRFTTKAGEDYASMSMMKTVGEDYVLHLRVRVK